MGFQMWGENGVGFPRNELISFIINDIRWIGGWEKEECRRNIAQVLTQFMPSFTGMMPGRESRQRLVSIHLSLD